MADAFFDENQTVIPFDGRYTPDPGEIFVIEDFKLDPTIVAAAKNPFGTQELNLSRSPFPQIKAIMMTELNSPLRIIFQGFKTEQIIRQGRALFFGFGGKNTYSELDVSGIAIGSEIDAVYDDGKLWFRSYNATNRIVDLTEYFHDATNEEIKDLLKMEGIVAADEDELLKHTDASMRRRFTIIKNTEILSLASADEIRLEARKQGLEIDIERENGNERIVVPSSKKEAKEVLEFLCQMRFVSALTKELCVANSFRPVATKKLSANADEEPRPAKQSSKKSAKKTAKKKTLKN